MSEQKKLTGYPSIDKPWLKYYSEEAINATLPESSLYEYLWENNKDFPNDIAINYLGRKITYDEFFRNIDRTAAAFVALGVKPREIVTVALPSIPEALYCVYALNKIGAVANMIHPLSGKQELLNYLNEVESRVAILFDGAYKLISDILGKTKLEHAVVVGAGQSMPFGIKQLYSIKSHSPKLNSPLLLNWNRFIRNGINISIPVINKRVTETAIISHTGGTTGDPKGVMCSDYSVLSCIYQSICCFSHEERQHIALAVLPPFVNYCLVQSMIEMLSIGYTVILLPKYEPNKIWYYFRKYQPNVVLSIPSYWEMLLNEENSKGVDLSCFEQIYYGGEAMNEETERAIDEVLKRHGSKLDLLKGLGSTELMAVASQTYPWCNEVGSVGIPLVKMNCKVVQPDTFEEATYNEQGEICFSGPTLMIGYYNNNKETEAIIKVHPDGNRWLHTGDLGYIDENGVIFVTGRIKRLIMTKGIDGQVTKLFPDRIEKAIASHPAVCACCVIGIPDEKRINYPKAYIELNDGFAASDELYEEIRRFCGSKLPEYQIPEEIEFTPVLPRTDRGKVDYRALEEIAKKETHE